MNGYEFLALTAEFMSEGMPLSEAYDTAKEIMDTVNSVPSGSFLDAA